MYACVFQGLGGGVPSLYHSRERRSEVLVKAGVVSEKEAVLLGESEQNQPVKPPSCSSEEGLNVLLMKVLPNAVECKQPGPITRTF